MYHIKYQKNTKIAIGKFYIDIDIIEIFRHTIYGALVAIILEIERDEADAEDVTYLRSKLSQYQ